jgi:DNA repair protein RecN (Recombination protein N)
MLQFLRIHRLAVIDAVEVDFGPGFNVLTGETGAGKSILIEAVGLLLGGRASGDLVRTGEDSATIEAIFEHRGQDLLVRREVTAQGRSRAFINGELTTASALKELATQLIEIHGQHEHYTLLDPSTHLAIIDAFGALDHLSAPVATAFDDMTTLAAALADLTRAEADRTTRQELIAFQLGELDRAELRPDEDEQLNAMRQVLASAERVEQLCAEGYSILYESDEAVLAQLGSVWRRVGDLAALEPRFQPYLEARESIKSQLEDLAMFLRRYADTIEASPERLQEIEARLALLERLKRKYGPTLADAIDRRDRLRREIDDLEGSEERSADLQRRYTQMRDAYLSAAHGLAAARRRVAPDFTKRIETLLGELAMERTQVEMRFNTGPLTESAWTARGVDEAELYVSPNQGEELRPLARVVSGGELSRIMLAIKTLTATNRHGFTESDNRSPGDEAPGLIFDEIDAGIGGRAADVVGRKLRTLGSAFQVLCITHLPQIAAYADTHYVIDKQVGNGRTVARVAKLDDSGRVEELARMLGGEAVTEGLRASAREMLSGRSQTASGRSPKSGERPSKGESERAKGERVAQKPRSARP